MRKLFPLFLAPALLAQAPVEFRLGAGVFFFAGGVDLQAQGRLARSPWLLGYRYVAWTDRFKDPYTGRHLTDTRETLTGPTFNYLFRPEARGSWMLGAAVYRCTKREESLLTGEVGRDAVTAPFLGGGYLRTGKHLFLQLGIYLAPGARLHTQTSVSSEDDSGLFDIQIQFGVRL